MDLKVSSKPQHLSWTAVELVFHSLYGLGRNVCQAKTFWKKFTKKSIRILVRAPLPGMMRQCKIKRYTMQFFRDPGVTKKLFAPVRRDGFDRMPPQSGYHLLSHFFASPPGHFW